MTKNRNQRFKDKEARVPAALYAKFTEYPVSMVVMVGLPSLSYEYCVVDD